ncbi:MAG TPA: hypothetical protein VMS87_05455 [Roseiarcus sp.]|nr:hypothetical protein [Roseiarcus sp.]
MKRRFLAAGTAVALCAVGIVAAPVLAGAPSVPATAKKLSGAEIVALYEGSTFKFTDFSSDVPNAGTVTFDFKNQISSGELDGYGHFIRSLKMDGDQICGQGGGYTLCRSVYVDGARIYEVDTKGAVRSTLQKQ